MPFTAGINNGAKLYIKKTNLFQKCKKIWYNQIMKKTVDNLNNLYKPTFENTDKMTKFLGSHCVDHALDFHYGHRIKINEKFTNELYPIPLFRFKLQGIKTEVFF